VGCGRGAVLARVAPIVQGSVGLDLSPAMVAECRTALAGVANVRVEVGDAQAPDPNLGQFDAVTASLVLFFLPEPAAALQRWRAHLVPGGRCVTSIFGAPDQTWQAIDQAFAPYLPARMLDARAQAGPLSPTSPDSDVDALFVEAGFEHVQTVTRTQNTRFDSAEQWEAFSWSTGQRAMWLAIPEERRPQVRATIANILRDSLHPDGGYVLSQAVRYTSAINPGT
jgi:SAM-dependent methyltransferase